MTQLTGGSEDAVKRKRSTIKTPKLQLILRACLNIDETGVCREIDLKNMVLLGNEDQLSKITGMKERFTFSNC